ncbi:Transposase IS4 [Popillia japonica]|uniref:Transposase IS4 n=1 Tax=Popillia japonica TaxID=7064 RepID=A0AAW1L8G8_POPJA
MFVFLLRLLVTQINGPDNAINECWSNYTPNRKHWTTTIICIDVCITTLDSIRKIHSSGERLQRLFAEVEGEEQADDDDEVAGAEEDATEIQEEVSDTEQEGDSSEEEEIAEKKGKCVYFLGRDKTSQWNKHCPSKKVRTRKANIVKHLPGVANCAKHTKSVLETWDLFFPEEILRIIVENTNKFITSISENYSRERDAMPTDIVEIKALLGLVYLSGVLKSSRLK